MTLKLRFSSAAVVILLLIFSAGCNFPGRSLVNIIITSHEDGQSVVMNEEIHLTCLATASHGVDSVEFYVNGVLTQTHTPTIESPEEFTMEELWTPDQEGSVVLTVKAIDTKGTYSDPVSIVLNVVSSVSEIVDTPTPTVTPEDFDQTLTAQVGCTNEAEFVEHVTIPINSYLTSGTTFTKIWRVRNTGDCDWVAYELIHVNGDILSASTPQALPVINAGENVDIAVDMVVPLSPGTYSAVWRLRSSDGTVFGPELDLTIIVPLLPTNTPNPTATFTLTLTATPTRTPTPTPTETSTPLSVEQAFATVSIAPGDWDKAVATCPPGSVVVSGGFAASQELRVYNSTKSGNGWQVFAINNSSATKNLNAYAYCLDNSGGSTSTVSNQINASASSTTYVTVACPTGSVITGGGWIIGTDEAVQHYNSSKYLNGWIIYVNNTGTSTPLIAVYAVCLSGVSGTTDIEYESIDLSAGSAGYISAACPSGSFGVGGGFAQHPDINTYNTSLDGNGWINYARNYGASLRTMFTYSVCYFP